MSRSMQQALLVSMLAGACSLACGVEKQEDWQLEIRLYLFSALAQPPDSVVVEASQEGGAPQTVTLNYPFASCEQNQVRIVPGQDAQAVFPPVTVTVATEKAIQATKTIALTQTTAVQLETLVVGDPASPSLAPAGDCQEHLPPVQLKSLGKSCGDDNECDGELCLRQMLVSGKEITFPDRYCSRDCSGGKACPEGSACLAETDSYSIPTSGKAYCLVSCQNTESCRQGYRCTDGNICFPE